MIQFQSTDTFQKSCKKPVSAQKTGLRGRTPSKISFSRQPVKADTFEGSRTPEHKAVKASSFGEKAWTIGTATFGAVALFVGTRMK